MSVASKSPEPLVHLLPAFGTSLADLSGRHLVGFGKTNGFRCNEYGVALILVPEGTRYSHRCGRLPLGQLARQVRGQWDKAAVSP